MEKLRVTNGKGIDGAKPDAQVKVCVPLPQSPGSQIGPGTAK